MRDAYNGWKYLTVARLRELLAALPDDLLVGPNAMFNLGLISAARQYIGYIDFAGDGKTELETPPGPSQE